MELADIVKMVRSYRGVVRKAPIESVARRLVPDVSRTVMAASGEDAAALRRGKEVLLLAADGIVEDLVDKDPEWAGYCSVLVNANDIAAMGGLPIAAVNVLSCRDSRVRTMIVRGMKSACDKFGVPMVGGHLHPDASSPSISVAMLGRTTPSRLVLSSSAATGDVILFAVDLDGSFTPGVPYSWDTTTRKSPGEVRKRLETMHRLAHLLTAAKDISNPGALGTLGMLLEASSKGAEIDLDAIPRPDKVDFAQWLLAYQGCGFVVTCTPKVASRVRAGFQSSGLTTAQCGRVRSGSRVELKSGSDSAILFDLRRDRLGCRPPQKI